MGIICKCDEAKTKTKEVVNTANNNSIIQDNTKIQIVIGKSNQIYLEENGYKNSTNPNLKIESNKETNHKTGHTSINVTETNIIEPSIKKLKNKNNELNYSKLDIEGDYFLGCPLCKRFNIEIKRAIYKKNYNDYKIFFFCNISKNPYDDWLEKLIILKENNINKYLTKQNSEMVKKILDEKKDRFKGYPFLEKIYEKYNIYSEEEEKKSIISNPFSLYDDINNPIKNIFWFDENINSEENKNYLKILNNSFREIKTLSDEQSLFETIEKSRFHAYIIIMNGRNFEKYINYVLNNSIYGIPISAIFTRNESELKEQIRDEYKNYLNDQFYNPLGISVTIESLIEKIKKFISDYIDQMAKISLGNSSPPKDYKKCFIFEFIDNDYKLIFPYLYNNILRNSKLSDKDIKRTNIYILENYGEEEKIKNLVVPLLNIENIPPNVIGKFWGRIYTIESPFYKNLNNNLMKLENNHYNEYIQILYKGLKEFEYKGNDLLYRGTNISNIEVENILNFYKDRKSNDEFQPSYLIYSRAFISFSKNKSVSMKFIRNTPGTKKILFQLKNRNNIKNLSNAYLYNISFYQEEHEVLFFPFSAFIIENIINQNDIYHISLEYLGRYEKRIKTKIKTVDKNTINKILTLSNFSKDTIKLNILPKKIENNNEIDIDIDKKETTIINTLIVYNNEVNFNNMNNEINCIYNGFENIIDLFYNDIGKINPEINENNIDIFVDDCQIRFNCKYVNDKKEEIKVKFKFYKVIENISYLFYNCTALKEVDLSLFNAYKLKDMSYMFSGCSSLESIFLNTFKSTQLQNLSYMCNGCYSLKEMDLSSININEVKNIEGLFNNCVSLNSVKLPIFNSRNVKGVSTIFNGCTSLNNRNINYIK